MEVALGEGIISISIYLTIILVANFGQVELSSKQILLTVMYLLLVTLMVISASTGFTYLFRVIILMHRFESIFNSQPVKMIRSDQ